MKLLISISRGPIAKLNDLKLQEVLKKKWPTARVLNSRLMSGDQRNAEYAYITADANSGNYMINRVVLGATGLGTNSFKVEKTAPAYGDFETLYDAVNALHRMDAPDTGRSTSNSPPLSSLTYYLSDFMVQAGPEIDKLLIDWRNEQTIAPLAYACYNPREDSVELQLIEASRDHRQWIKDKFFDALQELFKKVNHRMKITIPISTRENFRRESVESESAAKTPAHIFAQVKGDTTLVIDRSHKATVSSALSAAKKAKKLAAGALKAKIDSGMAQNQATRAEGAAKERLRTKYKTLKTKASTDAKEAKELLRTAAASLRKAGLSSVALALPASVITLTTGPGKSLRTVNAAQVDQLRVKGKKGTFKPKFGDVAKILASSGKKPSHAESVKLGKKKMAEKIAAKRKGAVTGAHTPAKAKEVRAKRVAALTGKKPEGSATAEKVDKALPGILKSVGFKFNVGRDAGLIRNQNGGKIAKSNEGLAKMREKLAKKFPVQDTPNGFEIPGLLQVKTGPTGVVIVRPDRYVKANDPAIRVRK